MSVHQKIILTVPVEDMLDVHRLTDNWQWVHDPTGGRVPSLAFYARLRTKDWWRSRQRKTTCYYPHHHQLFFVQCYDRSCNHSETCPQEIAMKWSVEKFGIAQGGDDGVQVV